MTFRMSRRLGNPAYEMQHSSFEVVFRNQLDKYFFRPACLIEITKAFNGQRNLYQQSKLVELDRPNILPLFIYVNGTFIDRVNFVST